MTEDEAVRKLTGFHYSEAAARELIRVNRASTSAELESLVSTQENHYRAHIANTWREADDYGDA